MCSRIGKIMKNDLVAPQPQICEIMKKRRRVRCVIRTMLVCFLVFPLTLNADEQATNSIPASIIEEQVTNPVPTYEMETLPAENLLTTNREFWLSILVLAFGVIVIFVEFFSLRSRDQVGAGDVIRLYGVTLILVGVLFVVVAGFDVDQIAPALGLFGTVAGYLLGKSADGERKGG